MTIAGHIFQTVCYEFKTNIEPYMTPSAYRIFIFYMIEEPMIIYNDREIPIDALQDLIEKEFVKCDGVHIHQGEKAIRYSFVSFKYPKKFYRLIPKDLREKILKKDGHQCVYCGSEKDLCIDHIFAWSKGGLTEENNLQTLCRRCNSKKHAN